MAKGATTAYWLGGEEHCPHCLLRYAFAVERRCTSCDGPTCPHCVTTVRETLDVICPECAVPSDEDADSERREG
jgi:hypothetical protein